MTRDDIEDIMHLVRRMELVNRTHARAEILAEMVKESEGPEVLDYALREVRQADIGVRGARMALEAALNDIAARDAKEASGE